MGSLGNNNYSLRISVTSQCNLNCKYCNPYRKTDPESIMTDKDILELAQAGLEAGITKISWTGGEPTVRKGFVELVKKIKKIGIKDQRLTTNGLVFYRIAGKLKEAGICRVNFSLDTLDRKAYKDMCGYDGLDKVLKSIKKSTEIFPLTKINCVAVKNNMKKIDQFINFVESYEGRLAIRFLEIVPCGIVYKKDPTFFSKNFVSQDEVLKFLKKYGKLIPLENKWDVPKSSYYKIEGMKGIYSINPNFSVGYRCDKKACNKIRVSPNGLVSNCTVNLEYVRDFRNKSFLEKKKMMKEIVAEKQNRDYKGFCHRQKYYDFWRFGIMPRYLKNKFDIKKTPLKSVYSG